ncbi:DEAD/DEAH box helicase [Mycolicibacterium sp. PAM1]|uniref:DEAD/DEAH box helicase n=1 Tax=Mycolicibacterium sp. PAM1 TaxID=2853535 RepID=UPI000C1B15E9|nr:DEAD/DEAH box helicase [Mycolicibacterium sp. PAM1]MBV5246632.1 DEAD/DEAH box helicase [Mycolicibacterium sp. PAM1]
MLRGLFIGIDKYPAPITRLTCARADALAIGSLFEDNSDKGSITKLVDADATRENILRAIEDLKAAHDDDFVVITFSGHGTDDHRLVPIDADASDLAGTCISLDELAVHLDAIPSRQMFVVLDCCFSGGIGGARVFAPTAARSPIEDRQSVERLIRGNGRLVLTASGAAEPAMETKQFGHGLLSYHLIHAVQGYGDYLDSDFIPLLALIGYVTLSVLDSAQILGEVQTPTVYGAVEGAPALPRLTAGASYAAAFPDRVRKPATRDWNSLQPFGFSQPVLDRWSSAMAALNDLQLSAINDCGVLDGKSLLVVAPTSSGKTMIGELAAVREAEHGARVVMLLPMRALVNDKFDYFRQMYGDHLSVVRATGEHADQVGMIYSGQFDLALLTYEKFLSIVTASPWVLRGVTLVVIDEAQNIAEQSRGPSLEFLVTLLRSGHARGGAPQVVALSAVIGDTNGLERWLGAELLRTGYRPIPLRESVIDGAGHAQHLNADGNSTTEPFVVPDWGVGGEGSKHIIIPLVRRLVDENKKVIVFRITKGETVGTARYLAQSLGLPPANSVLSQLPDGDLSTTSHSLRAALRGGVGFHNADLNPDERAALETRFRDPLSDLKVIVATTTLAMGINTPAEAVVIAGLTHPDRSPYSVAEYKNMAGRAGRVGFADEGQSYIVATGDPPPLQAWLGYVQGQPESVRSHFLDASTDPQTLILRSLVTLGGSVLRPELLALLENSFAIWQRVDRGGPGWDHDALNRDLEALSRAELLDIEPDGRVSVTELGRYAGESGIEVRSVTQVSSLLRFAPAGRELTEADLVSLAQVTVELDETYLPVAVRSRQEQFRWYPTASALGVDEALLRGLHVGGGDPLTRAKKAAAVLLFASDSPIASIEAELMQHMRNTAVAGPIRSVAARTRDVIDAVATICRVRGYKFADEVGSSNLGVRLEIGLPSRIGGVAAELGTRLSRVEYLKLLAEGLETIAALQTAGDALRNILGDERAEQVLQWIADPVDR